MRAKAAPTAGRNTNRRKGAFIIGYQEKEPVSQDETDLLKLDTGQGELEVGEPGSFAIGTGTDPEGFSD